MRLLVALVIFFITPEFNGQAKGIEDLDSEYGLPILITEEEKKRALQKKRSKVLTQSVARKVTRIVEAFDEAGVAEDKKAIILKSNDYSKAEKERSEERRVGKECER